MSETPDKTAALPRLLWRQPPDFTATERETLQKRLISAVEFQRSLASGCDHIRVVRELLVDDDGFWWVEEPADAVELESQLVAAPLEARRVARYGVQLCDALLHACYPPSGEPRPHGTLRPKCVFLVEGRICVSDFGVAQAFSDALTPGAARDELELLAPYVSRELWLNSDTYGELRDEFAVGVILYELATGQHPFNVNRSDALDCQYRILAGQNHPALKHNANLDLVLADILDRAVSKQEQNRYPSLKELRAALAAFAGPDPIEEVLAKARAVDPSDRQRLEAALREIDAVLQTPEGRPQKARLQAAHLRLESEILRLQVLDAIHAQRFDEAERNVERLRPLHPSLADELATQVHQAQSALLRQTLSESASRKPQTVEELAQLHDQIARLAADGYATPDLRHDAHALTERKTAEFIDAESARIRAFLDREEVDRAAAIHVQLRTLGSKASAVQSTGIEQLSRRIDALRTEIEQRIAAEHEQARAWCESFRAMVDSRNLEGADRHLQQRPRLKHWPEDAVAAEAEARARLERLKQEILKQEIEADRDRLKVWLAEVDQALGAEKWEATEKLLDRPPSLVHRPPNMDEEVRRRRDAVTQAKYRQAVTADEKAAWAWLTKLQELVDAKQIAAADSQVSRRPTLTHWPPEALKAEAKALERLKRWKQESLAQAIERDRSAADAWLGQIREAIQHKNWSLAKELLNKPLSLSHPPADLAARRERLAREADEREAAEKREQAREADHRTAREWMDRLQSLVKAGNIPEARACLQRRPVITDWPPETLHAENKAQADILHQIIRRQHATVEDLQREVAAAPSVQPTGVAPGVKTLPDDRRVDDVVITLRPPKPFRTLRLRAVWDDDELAFRKDSRWFADLARFPRKRRSLRPIVLGGGGVLAVALIVYSLLRPPVLDPEKVRKTAEAFLLQETKGESVIPEGYVPHGTEQPPGKSIGLAATWVDGEGRAVVNLSITALDGVQFVFPVKALEEVSESLNGRNDSDDSPVTLGELRALLRKEVRLSLENAWRDAMDEVVRRFDQQIPGWNPVDTNAPPPEDLSRPVEVPLIPVWPMTTPTVPIKLTALDRKQGWDVGADQTNQIRNLAVAFRKELHAAVTQRLQNVVSSLPVGQGYPLSAFLADVVPTLPVSEEFSWRIEGSVWMTTATVSLRLGPTAFQTALPPLDDVELTLVDDDTTKVLSEKARGSWGNSLSLSIGELQARAFDELWKPLKPVFRDLRIANDPTLPSDRAELVVNLFGRANVQSGTESPTVGNVTVSVVWNAKELAWAHANAVEFERQYHEQVSNLVKALAEEGIAAVRVLKGYATVTVGQADAIEAPDGALQGFILPLEGKARETDEPIRAKVGFPLDSPPNGGTSLESFIADLGARALISCRRAAQIIARDAMNEIVRGFASKDCLLRIAQVEQGQNGALIFVLEPQNPVGVFEPVRIELPWDETTFAYDDSKLQDALPRLDRLCPVNWQEIVGDRELWDAVRKSVRNDRFPAGHWLNQWAGAKLNMDNAPDAQGPTWTLTVGYPWSEDESTLDIGDLHRSHAIVLSLKDILDGLQNVPDDDRRTPANVAKITQNVVGAVQGEASPPHWSGAANYAERRQEGFALERLSAKELDNASPARFEELYGPLHRTEAREQLKMVAEAIVRLRAVPRRLALVNGELHLTAPLTADCPAERLKGPGWFVEPTWKKDEPDVEFKILLGAPPRPNPVPAIPWDVFQKKVNWTRAADLAIARIPQRIDLENEIRQRIPAGGADPRTPSEPIIVEPQTLANWVQRLSDIKRADTSSAGKAPPQSLDEITRSHRKTPDDGKRKTHFIELFWGVRGRYALMWVAGEPPLTATSPPLVQEPRIIVLDREVPGPTPSPQRIREYAENLLKTEALMSALQPNKQAAMGVVLAVDGLWADLDVEKISFSRKLQVNLKSSTGGAATNTDIESWGDLRELGGGEGKLLTGLWVVGSLADGDSAKTPNIDKQAAYIFGTSVRPISP